MATIRHTCGACGREGTADVGQSLGIGLRWFLSFRCAYCGAALEADGDDAPADVRRAILMEQGTFVLRVEVAPPNRVRALAALRALLELSLEETKARLSGEVARGTDVEMEHLRRELAERGITAMVRRAGRATGA